MRDEHGKKRKNARDTSLKEREEVSCKGERRHNYLTKKESRENLCESWGCIEIREKA